VATDNSENVKALDEDKYKCELDSSDSSIIKIFRYEDINTDKFRIKAFVQNPYSVDYSGYLIYYYELFNNQNMGQVIAVS
jgi:hypothetical protein